MHREAANAHSLERLVFFSDAVFAIAITLLVIEIDVPELSGDPHQALAELGQRIPQFFGFVLSFLVIGRFWRGHHTAFGWTRVYADRLVWPNTFLLMAIAFMPFSTALMSENIGQLVPTLTYNVVLLITAACSARVIAMAISTELAPDIPVAERQLMYSRGIGVILGTLSALALTFASPVFRQIALITIPLWQRVTLRWLQRHPVAAAQA